MPRLLEQRPPQLSLQLREAHRPPSRLELLTKELGHRRESGKKCLVNMGQSNTNIRPYTLCLHLYKSILSFRCSHIVFIARVDNTNISLRAGYWLPCWRHSDICSPHLTLHPSLVPASDWSVRLQCWPLIGWDGGVMSVTPMLASEYLPSWVGEYHTLTYWAQCHPSPSQYALNWSIT